MDDSICIFLADRLTTSQAITIALATRRPKPIDPERNSSTRSRDNGVPPNSDGWFAIEDLLRDTSMLDIHNSKPAHLMALGCGCGMSPDRERRGREVG